MKLFVSVKTRSVFEEAHYEYRDRVPAWRQLWLHVKARHNEQAQKVSQISFMPPHFLFCKFYFHNPKDNQRGCDSSVFSLKCHIYVLHCSERAGNRLALDTGRMSFTLPSEHLNLRSSEESLFLQSFK